MLMIPVMPLVASIGVCPNKGHLLVLAPHELRHATCPVKIRITVLNVILSSIRGMRWLERILTSVRRLNSVPVLPYVLSVLRGARRDNILVVYLRQFYY